jgi:phytoene synthase
LAPQVRDLIARRGLSVDDFIEIIRGCEMDLCGTVYETWEDLRLYCHRVASCVGLVSIDIFGAKAPEAKTYAIELGLAFQVTNIIRDVGHDYSEMGRIYLPREEMARFGVDADGVAAGRQDEGFRNLMEFEAERAEECYRRACAAFPKREKRALVAAEIMRRVYYGILEKMRADGFRVLEKNYRLSRLEKLACVVRGVLSSF